MQDRSFRMWIDVLGIAYEWVLNNAGVKERTTKDCQSKEASILWSHKEVVRRKKSNARNNARYTQARKTTQNLDGQHQNVDRTHCERVSQNGR